MALKYYHATNSGKGFITFDDYRTGYIESHPGDIWTTENTTWATRVSATEKTLEEAQTLVDSAISGSVYNDDYPVEALRGTQITYTLPTE